VGIGASIGTAWFPMPFYHPTGLNEPVSFDPGPAIGIYTSFARYQILAPAQIELSIQAVYSKSSSHEANKPYGLRDASSEQAAIIVCPRFTTETQLAPFIEVGIGYGFTTIRERYTLSFLESPTVRTLGFKLEVGAGISFDPAAQFSVEAYTQTIHLLRRVSVSANADSYNLAGHYTLDLGVRVVYYP